MQEPSKREASNCTPTSFPRGKPARCEQIASKACKVKSNNKEGVLKSQRSQESQRNYHPELGKPPSQGSGSLPAVFGSNPRSYQCRSPDQMILMYFSGVVTWREGQVKAKSCLRSPSYNTDLFYPVYDISSRLGDPIAWQISFNLFRVFSHAKHNRA